MAKKPKKTAKPKLNPALAGFVRAVINRSGEREAGNQVLLALGEEPVVKASDHMLIRSSPTGAR